MSQKPDGADMVALQKILQSHALELDAKCQTLGILMMDRSSSMKVFGDTPRRALNEYLRELGKLPNHEAVSVGIFTFDAAVQMDVPISPVAKVPSMKHYDTGYGTRLYGTVFGVLGHMLPKIEAMLKTGADLETIVAVFTDGYDSVSRECLPEVQHLAARAIQFRCKLIVFGIGVDAKAIAREMGFPEDLAIDVPATREGVRTATTRVTEISTTSSARDKFSPRFRG
ncbi:MAG: hypothetical protein WCJ29_06470 [bacterium]